MSFENAKVGDAVWDLRYGWGSVRGVSLEECYPILVVFDMHPQGLYRYDQEGKDSMRTLTPMLYWSEVEIEAPKRKVKRVFWVQLREDGSACWHTYEFPMDRPNCLGGKAHRIEIEVEE